VKVRQLLAVTAIVVAYCAVSTMDYTDQAAEAEHTAAVLHDARLTSRERKALARSLIGGVE